MAKITKEERQQSLLNARRACEWLSGFIASQPLGIRAWEEAECLIAEFTRLDAKEQTQIKAGKKFGKLGAVHGRKGGWPKGKPRGKK